MYFTEQPHQLLERLMKHTLEHFQINPTLSTITISYQGKVCEVFSSSVEPFYLEAFKQYEEETRCYQEALAAYEVIEQLYLLEKTVTAEELARHQELVHRASPREHSLWYEEVILKIINDDKETFAEAMDLFLSNKIRH